MASARDAVLARLRPGSEGLEEIMPRNVGWPLRTSSLKGAPSEDEEPMFSKLANMQLPTSFARPAVECDGACVEGG